ncbi:FHA domain-containing protein [Micromonospora sp. S4605]|nr:FHA domain-containing protein [Micromonospora sp. S4605]
MEEHPNLLPLLTVAGGSMRGASFRVRRTPLVIGRAPTVDVVLNDLHLSRRHAQVWLTPEGVSLADLGSTNGTWLNDRRITGEERLSDGDVIRLGRTELRFFDPGVAVTDPVGLLIGTPRRDHRPTLPLPVAAPPAVARPAERTVPVTPVVRNAPGQSPVPAGPGVAAEPTVPPAPAVPSAP